MALNVVGLGNTSRPWLDLQGSETYRVPRTLVALAQVNQLGVERQARAANRRVEGP